MRGSRLSLALLGLGALVAVAIGAAGPLMSQVEQPAYDLRDREGAFEVRTYPALIVAEVTVVGDRRTAIGGGFGIVAKYIFGNNASRRSVAMTAPVLQQRVGQATLDTPQATPDTSDDSNAWAIRFVMPRRWSLDTLPKPKDARITLAPQPAATFAVVRFSGLAGAGTLAEKTRALTAFIQRRKLHPAGSPIFAFFNPPWTLPFLRRNEIMIAVT